MTSKECLKHITQDLERLEKLEKVIEILKKKTIEGPTINEIEWWEYYETCEQMNIDEDLIANEEEWEVLKEVLGND